MADENPEALFGAVTEALASRKIGYLHVVDPSFEGNPDIRQRAQQLMRLIRERFSGPLILCGGYDRERAEAALQENRADLIGFGRPFIANPDLPLRLETHAPLNTPDPSLFYGGGIQGYVDYPTRAEELGTEPPPDFSGLN
jgi:N-ethylmaleimide reductase